VSFRVVLIALALTTGVVGWVTVYLTAQFREVKEGVEWLEPRAFEGLTVVAVGTGIEYENPGRLGPATLIGAGPRAVLVVAGRGVRIRLEVGADAAPATLRVPVSGGAGAALDTTAPMRAPPESCPTLIESVPTPCATVRSAALDSWRRM